MTRPAFRLQHRDTRHSGPLLDQVREIVARQRYGTEYQPIVSTRTGEITAYEALARFYTPAGELLPSQSVFEVMHHEPALLRRAECDLKQLQMGFAPADYDLFLNLDPHAITPVNGQAPALVERLIRTPGIVIELIENTDIHDARAGLDIHKMLAGHGVRTALDDIGAPHALLSLDLISAVDFFKFDCSWFSRLKQNRGQQMFRSMLSFAREAGRQTVLEGVTDMERLQLSHDYGIDRVQGFLYRSQFRAIAP
jgi:EAL domain-containing protein (putative c-di-GMP-specific phosphodiesterase class I)